MVISRISSQVAKNHFRTWTISQTKDSFSFIIDAKREFSNCWAWNTMEHMGIYANCYCRIRLPTFSIEICCFGISMFQCQAHTRRDASSSTRVFQFHPKACGLNYQRHDFATNVSHSQSHVRKTQICGVFNSKRSKSLVKYGGPT